MIVAGVDGCPGGWVAALVDTVRREAAWRLLGDDPAEVAALLGEAAYVGIDIPIGLVDRGRRECDDAVRRLLAPTRGSSVFPAPARPLLDASSHTEACAIGRALDGRGISVQCWHITWRIRAIDSIATPALQDRLVEVHPELSFQLLAGGDLGSKRLAAGRAARTAALAAWLPGTADAVRARPRLARTDDALDALAAAWSTARWAAGEALVVPADPPRDSRGLLMAIVA